MNEMKTRYRLIFRGVRGGMFYCVDKVTGKRTSLQTTNEDEARQIIEAKNNSVRQPVLNLQIAKAYLAGSDNGIATRTWRQALDSLASTKQAANRVKIGLLVSEDDLHGLIVSGRPYRTSHSTAFSRS